MYYNFNLDNKTTKTDDVEIYVLDTNAGKRRLARTVADRIRERAFPSVSGCYQKQAEKYSYFLQNGVVVYCYNSRIVALIRKVEDQFCFLTPIGGAKNLISRAVDKAKDHAEKTLSTSVGNKEVVGRNTFNVLLALDILESYGKDINFFKDLIEEEYEERTK
jgi:hypothetical protein